MGCSPTERESNDVLVIEMEDKSAIKSTKESNVTENTVENKEAIVFEEQSIIVEENKLEPSNTGIGRFSYRTRVH